MLHQMPGLLVPTEDFNVAKTQLSHVMTEVVREHHPTVINRNRGKELALLLGLKELGVVLDRFRFEPQVSVADGEWVVRLPELGLLAGGDSYETAFDHLIEVVEEYAEEYFQRLDFLIQTDRAEQLPYLLRIATASEEERRAMLEGAPPEA
jgi:predicted RNase H-like HicB family nuclease